MISYTVAVRLHGIGADGPEQIAEHMEEGSLIEDVEATAGTEQWQTELRVKVWNDSIAGAVVMAALRLRKACHELRIPPDRVAIAGVEPSRR